MTRDVYRELALHSRASGWNLAQASRRGSRADSAHPGTTAVKRAEPRYANVAGQWEGQVQAVDQRVGSSRMNMPAPGTSSGAVTMVQNMGSSINQVEIRKEHTEN